MSKISERRIIRRMSGEVFENRLLFFIQKRHKDNHVYFLGGLCDLSFVSHYCTPLWVASKGTFPCASEVSENH